MTRTNVSERFKWTGSKLDGFALELTVLGDLHAVVAVFAHVRRQEVVRHWVLRLVLKKMFGHVVEFVPVNQMVCQNCEANAIPVVSLAIEACSSCGRGAVGRSTWSQ